MEGKTYDVVIVLANEMDSHGTLNDETQARVDQACQQMSNGHAGAMLLMGWDYRPDTSLCIADAMHKYVEAHHTFDPDRILIDRRSRDTVGDAVFSKLNLTHLAQTNSLCVVTSDYHQKRTQIIFDFVYGNDWEVDVIGVPTAQARENGKAQAEDKAAAERASLDAFRQTFSGVKPGDDAAIFAAMREKHPFYNGSVYPQITSD